jgi:hypothetical protein
MEKTLKRQNHAEENFATQRMYAHQLITIIITEGIGSIKQVVAAQPKMLSIKTNNDFS